MEIGTSTVRLAEVNKRGKTVEITKTFVFDTPDDAARDGHVRVTDAVVSAIKDGIDESGIKAKDVYFVVESTKIAFKQVELPFVQNKKMIQQMLESSFTDIFPLDEVQYHVSYVLEKVYEKNAQKMMSLSVFAIPHTLSESYYNLAVALNLNVKGLTDPNRSIIGLFPLAFKNRNVAMININEGSSTLGVSVDGNLVFNKTIPYGVNAALTQIMNSPLTMEDITVTDASELLYSQNILMKRLPSAMDENAIPEEKLRYATTVSVVSLIKSIEAAFAKFLRKENVKIDEFTLSGLGAGFAGISQLLSNTFGIPVKIIQQEGNLRINQMAADDVMLLSCYPCVGAAIDQANFFTALERAGGDMAKKRKLDKLFIFTGVLVFIACFAYSGYTYLQANLKYQDVYSENTRLKKHVQELRDLGVEIAYNNYTTAISYNEEVIKLYNLTKSGNEDMTVFLHELESILPITARVQSLTITPETASVSVVCEDRYVAAGVLHLIRNMDTITNMECNGVSESNKTGENSFIVNLTLKTTEMREQEEAEKEDQNGDTGEGNEDDKLDENESETDEENSSQEPDDTDKFLTEIAEINTTNDISKFLVGEEEWNVQTIGLEFIKNKGFRSDTNFFMTANEAIAISGLIYSNESGIDFGVIEGHDNVIYGIKVNTDKITFYNGVKVGMLIDDALKTLNVDGLEMMDGYIIIKSEQNTLLLVADFDDNYIDDIYLLNNTFFDANDSNENVEYGTEETNESTDVGYTEEETMETEEGGNN